MQWSYLTWIRFVGVISVGHAPRFDGAVIHGEEEKKRKRKGEEGKEKGTR